MLVLSLAVLSLLPARSAHAVSSLTLFAPTGAAAFDYLGHSVAGAGDVNGDGFADVIVGAPNDDAGGADAGRAYVYYGGPSADATADLILTGAAAIDFFGYSVAGAGDVNGDGFADLIVGAWGNDAAGTDAGRAYVYYGGPAAADFPNLTLTTAVAGDQFGISVAGAGDVNGDGFADLIVGAWSNDFAGSNAGRAYVYYGGLAPDPTADLSLTGAAAGDRFGISVAGAGDVNGDGFGDVIVGAYQNDAGGPNAGRAYIYYGGSAADATADLTLTGAAAGDQFGVSVAGVGNVNRDGFADLIVGAYANSAGGFQAGRAYLYYGGPTPDATADLTLTGGAAVDFFGFSVEGTGDVNGDGFADLIVGAFQNDAGGADAGQAYLYYGGPAGDAVADLVLTGAVAGDQFGYSVAGAGDVNGNGLADLIVGARFNDAGDTDAGRAYVFTVYPLTGVALSGAGEGLEFSPPWPNPGRSGEPLNLRLTLGREEQVGFELYDIIGRRVYARAPERLAAGVHTVALPVPGHSSGIHFLRLDVGARRRVTLRVVRFD